MKGGHYIGLILLLAATPAAAVQTHSDPEGLVSHQAGHILFLAGLIYLLTQLSGKSKYTGWAQFKLFLWLMILWNILTFSNHLIMEFMPADHFITHNGQTSGLFIGGALDLFFYISHLDHLLLVPALAAFYIALRKWRQKT